MHDVEVLRVSAQNVWDYLAEGLWKDSFVDVLDGVVHVFFGSTNAAKHISIIHFSFRFSCSLLM